MNTMTEGELQKRLAGARLIPNMAHLPAFGLLAPGGWDYQDPALLKRAQRILARAGIVGTVFEAAPALFWYWDAQGELQLHSWDTKKARRAKQGEIR